MGACLSSLDQTAEGPRGAPFQSAATSVNQSASYRSDSYRNTPTKNVTSQVMPDGSMKITTKTETRNSDGSISVTVVESVEPAGTQDTSSSSFASEAKTCVRAQSVPGSVRPPPVSPACVSSLDQTAGESRGAPYQPRAVGANQSTSYRSDSYRNTPMKNITSQVMPDGSMKITTKTETRNSDGSISVTVVESVEPAGTQDTSASSFASEAKTCVRAQSVPGSVRPPPGSPACVSSLDQTAGGSRGALYQPRAAEANQSASYRSTGYRNTPAQVQAGSRVFSIVVNGIPITGRSKMALLASGVLPGRYWRDFTAGFYGREGGPALGVSQVPIPGAGPLQPDASCRPAGQTNIFINGREVHPTEVANLLPIMMQPGGRWRLDSQMNVYQEANDMFIGSLAEILGTPRFQQGRGGGGGLGGALKALRALGGDDDDGGDGGGGGGGVDWSGVDWSGGDGGGGGDDWSGGVDWSAAYNPDGTNWALDGDGGFSWFDASTFFMDS
jgi:hypothetical protein